MSLIALLPFKRALWSIGVDQQILRAYLKRIDFRVVPIWFTIYSVWWNSVPRWILLLPGKKYLVLSNFVESGCETLETFKSYDSDKVVWICPSVLQIEKLKSLDVLGKTDYLPILVSDQYLERRERYVDPSKKIRIVKYP